MVKNDMRIIKNKILETLKSLGADIHWISNIELENALRNTINSDNLGLPLYELINDSLITLNSEPEILTINNFSSDLKNRVGKIESYMLTPKSILYFERIDQEKERAEIKKERESMKTERKVSLIINLILALATVISMLFTVFFNKPC